MKSKTALVVAAYLAESLPPKNEIEKKGYDAKPITQHVAYSGDKDKIERLNTNRTTIGLLTKNTRINTNDLEKGSKISKQLTRDHVQNRATISRPYLRNIPKSI